MSKKLVLQLLLFFPLLVNCQTFDFDKYYGDYIGILSSEIKNPDRLKHYMLLSLEKNFCGINFNQLEDQKFIPLTNDITCYNWNYKCKLTALLDNRLQIQSTNFYFTLEAIDSLRLIIKNSTYLQYVGDTIYRVTCHRYKGDPLSSGWSYLPAYNQSLGESIWGLNYYIDYPEKPVWYFYNFETNNRTFVPDSLFSHPLTQKIRNKIKK
jgi:hypothetical protein